MSDPNLSHEAVKSYREMFRLCPNFGRRQEIVSTVNDLNLWQTVLMEWNQKKWNPLKIGWLLSEYEQREKSGNRSAAAVGRSNQRRSKTEAVQVGVSERRGSNVPCVQEGARVRFRAGRETLAEIVTKALQHNNRSKAEVER